MDYATTWMYAHDANLNFTACSFPKLQHDVAYNKISW